MLPIIAASSRPLGVRPAIVAELHYGTVGSRYPSSSSLHSLLDSRSGFCLELCVRIQVVCRVTFASVASTCALQRIIVYYYMLGNQYRPDPANLSS